MKKIRSENSRAVVCAAAFFWSILLGAPVVVLSPSSVEARHTVLYSVLAGFDCPSTANEVCNTLNEVNPWTGATISSIPITLVGETVVGATGLATDPTTQTLYALLKLSGRPSRELVTINPATGVAVSIGDTLDRFADLAFHTDGTLFGVTGDGAITPHTLFTLDTMDAASDFVLELGSRFGGQAIAFNPDDGLMYHAYGFREPNRVFESINLSMLTITNILLSDAGVGRLYGEATGMTYGGSGVFWVGALNPDNDPPPLAILVTVTTSGDVSFIGPTGPDPDNEFFTAGLAFVDFFEGVGGSVASISSTNVTVKCKNETTGDFVEFDLLPDVTTWDCEAEGLPVISGDQIEMEMQMEGEVVAD